MLRFRNTSFGSTPHRVQFESFLGYLDDENSLDLSVDLIVECLWHETGIDANVAENRLASQFIVASDFHGQKFAYFFIPRYVFCMLTLLFI